MDALTADDRRQLVVKVLEMRAGLDAELVSVLQGMLLLTRARTSTTRTAGSGPVGSFGSRILRHHQANVP